MRGSVVGWLLTLGRWLAAGVTLAASVVTLETRFRGASPMWESASDVQFSAADIWLAAGVVAFAFFGAGVVQPAYGRFIAAPREARRSKYCRENAAFRKKTLKVLAARDFLMEADPRHRDPALLLGYEVGDIDEELLALGVRFFGALDLETLTERDFSPLLAQMEHGSLEEARKRWPIH